MSDLKSKLPDINELGAMASKLFTDIKTSVNTIIEDYKLKHPPKPDEEDTPVAKPEEPSEKPKTKASVTPIVEPIVKPKDQDPKE